MIISVSGYGGSGSSAVEDLLKEYEEIDFLKHGEEFNLLYMPDGILDLEYHLVKSPQRFFSSDVAIRRFISYAKKISRMPNCIYSSCTHGNFYKLTLDYINKIVQMQWDGYWLYDLFDCNELMRTWKFRIFDRVFSKIENKSLRKKNTFLDRRMYLSIWPENFYEETKKYLYMLLQHMGADLNQKVMVSQLFAGNNPESGMQFFDDAKAIVVDRDPRDIYILIKKYVPSSGHWFASDTVQEFVQYYKIIHNGFRSENERVMLVQFEDLIYEMDNVVRKIERFLDIHKHKNAGLYFNPQKSMNNTQLFLINDQFKDDIAFIEKELSDYLYDFPQMKAWKHNEEDVY